MGKNMLQMFFENYIEMDLSETIDDSQTFKYLKSNFFPRFFIDRIIDIRRSR